MATVYEIMNQLSNIRCEMREQIALLTLNRPEALNALNSKTLEELDLIFERIRRIFWASSSQAKAEPLRRGRTSYR